MNKCATHFPSLWGPCTESRADAAVWTTGGWAQLEQSEDVEEEAIFRVGTLKAAAEAAEAASRGDIVDTKFGGSTRDDKKERNARKERELMWFHVWG